MATFNRLINTSQFSSADLQRIIDHIAILISIDRKNALHNKGESHEKSYEQTSLYTQNGLATVFQSPHEVHTALALRGSQVVAKNQLLGGVLI